MADDETEKPSPTARKGLHVPTIQRGNVARVAIRSIRLAEKAAWQALQFLIAIIILFEEWGWKPLFAAMARLARLAPIARLEAAVADLPPWPALAVFLAPPLLFLPLKLAALWLIAEGHALSAILLFVFAKVAGTALYARIFHLTHPALMQLPWFARLYNRFIPWKDQLIEMAKASPVWQAAMRAKHRVSLVAAGIWRKLQPTVLGVLDRLRAYLAR